MRIIAALFSMLMPGFGQVYNREFIKGMVFLLIEHYDNIAGHVNTAIFLDFNGYHQEAIKATNFGAMLFYPGFYVYCVWDAWYYAKAGGDKIRTPIPYIIGGVLGTISAIYAPRLPAPTLVTGLAMIVPMIFGMFIFRKQ